MANVIFDFDGTIADSFDYVLEFLVGQTKQKLPVTDKERADLHGITMAQMALRLHIPIWRLPFLFWKGRKAMALHIDMLHLFPGMKEAVRNLQSDGHNLFVVSSNSVQNIRIFLEKNDMSKDFIKLYSGGFGLFGKATVLRRLLKRQKLSPPETYYVGDEVRDIEAAKKAGIRIISVTWGYNNEAILRKHEPDFVVTKPTDIRKAVVE